MTPRAQSILLFAAVLVAAFFWFRPRWARCLLIGHRWSNPHSVADTGEYACECTRCDQDGDSFSDDDGPLVWRLKLLREKRREFAHQVLCLLGRHVEHDWNDKELGENGITCVWCWKFLGKFRHRPADREGGER